MSMVAEAPKKVLIIKPSSLGDVVTAVPMLRGLRRTFPWAKITWMLSDACAPLVEDDEDLDEVLLFRRKLLGKWWRSPRSAGELRRFLRSLRQAKFDWVLDLQGLFRSGFFAQITGAPLRAGFADAREGATLFYTHRLRPDGEHIVDINIAFARELGIDVRPEDFRLSVSDAERTFANAFRDARGLRGEDFIVCVPPTRWQTKVYPVRHWRTVVAALSERTTVALLGSPSAEEVQLCEAIAEGMGENVVNLAGQTNLKDIVGLIAASAGVICSDSAAQYIATAVGVDVLALIGPTNPRRTGPYRGHPIVADVPCQGCLARRCRHIVCMESIDPTIVIAEAERMLS